MEKKREDVGRVWPEVGAEDLGLGGGGEFGEVVAEFGGGVSPREVGVALGEPGFCEDVHHFGAGECLGQKDGVRVFRLEGGDHVLPERDGFGVGIVDAEDADALGAPEADDVRELFPEISPVGVMEVEGVDVLIFFGGILGVFDGAVGTFEEPVGVFVNVGMVGGAVDGKVECDFHPAGADFFDQPREIFERAEFWRDVAVSAPVGAVLVTVSDGVGDAGFSGFAGEGVVASFSGGDANRVDGREIDDVESHGFGVFDAGQAFAECCAAMAFAGCGTWEKLVPRRTEGFSAIHHHEGVSG
ncbi:MAG: hypothetical protein RIS92_696 [Verrucomicrobiota bacterium]